MLVPHIRDANEVSSDALTTIISGIKLPGKDDTTDLGVAARVSEIEICRQFRLTCKLEYIHETSFDSVYKEHHNSFIGK